MVGCEAVDTRERILIAAADLLAEGGADAVSTRAVSAAAGVQAPTLYRLFGDKQGLLDAVTAYGFERYLADKQAMAATEDPVEDLRRGWDLHVEFGLTHPSFYVLMYGAVRPGERPSAAGETHRVLLGMLGRVARAGRLRVPVEQAAEMIQATCAGVALALISASADARDLSLSTRTRDAVLATLTTQSAPANEEVSVSSRAIALDAVLSRSSDAFTAAEFALLREWLARLASRP
ncbi:TetR/AcrR family transcriptional regulator [Streptomyces silvisoli]|uniref:TetR/AcrR family transcriptional regulator n=1 Tax=Streptomyces silvisoli TaxID=3034235 RepID=A0ABT5ZJ36_9ACTN|nr:TetR/AcrR family transcriptional regulator [Streptomyces silvisoli]MDF3289847.1 TetR/AcrR family transcriptional regulator [Streptomyces silvisoli]